MSDRRVIDETFQLLLPTNLDGVPTTPDDVTVTVYDPEEMDGYGALAFTLDTGKTWVYVDALECNKFRPGRNYLVDVTVDVDGNIGTKGATFQLEPNMRFAKTAIYSSGGDFGTDKMRVLGPTPQTISVTFQSGAATLAEQKLVGVDDGEDARESTAFGQWRFKYDATGGGTTVERFIAAMAEVGIILETSLTPGDLLTSHVTNGQTIDWYHVVGVRAFKYGTQGNRAVVRWINDVAPAGEYLAINGEQFEFHYDSDSTDWLTVRSILDRTEHLRAMLVTMPDGSPSSYLTDTIADFVVDGEEWTLGGGEWIDDQATVDTISPSYYRSEDEAKQQLGGIWTIAWRFNMRGGDAKPLWGSDIDPPYTSGFPLIASEFYPSYGASYNQPGIRNDRDRMPVAGPGFTGIFEAASADSFDNVSGFDFAIVAVIRGGVLFLQKYDGVTGWQISMSSGVAYAYLYGSGSTKTVTGVVPDGNPYTDSIVMLAVNSATNKGRMAVLNADGTLGLGAETDVTGLGSLTTTGKFKISGCAPSFVMAGLYGGAVESHLEDAIRNMGQHVFGRRGLENVNLVQIKGGAVPTPSITGVPTVLLDNSQVSTIQEPVYELLYGNTDWDVKVPPKIAVPATGTRDYAIEISGNSSEFGDVYVDDVMTISVYNEAGVDRSARLDSTTMDDLGTGTYRAIYTATAGDPDEELLFRFEGETTNNVDARVVSRWGVAVVEQETGVGGDTPDYLLGPECLAIDAEQLVFFRVPSSLETQTGLVFTGHWVDQSGTVNTFTPALLGWADEFAEVDATDAAGVYSFAANAEHTASAGGVVLYLQANTYDEGLIPIGDPFTVGFGVVAATDGADVNVATIDAGAIDSNALAASALTAMANAFWGTLIEGSNTAADMVRGIMSGVMGPVTGFLSGILVFKSLNGAKTRFTVPTVPDGRETPTPGDLT